jgi:hypothetical protein
MDQPIEGKTFRQLWNEQVQTTMRDRGCSYSDAWALCLVLYKSLYEGFVKETAPIKRVPVSKREALDMSQYGEGPRKEQPSRGKHVTGNAIPTPFTNDGRLKEEAYEFVNERMTRWGEDYNTAWREARRLKPELFGETI